MISQKSLKSLISSKAISKSPTKKKLTGRRNSVAAVQKQAISIPIMGGGMLCNFNALGESSFGAAPKQEEKPKAKGKRNSVILSSTTAFQKALKIKNESDKKNNTLNKNSSKKGKNSGESTPKLIGKLSLKSKVGQRRNSVSTVGNTKKKGIASLGSDSKTNSAVKGKGKRNSVI